ncbi:ADP-ribosylglycohydrolase [Kaistia soli DSM 19436]|uniref:ADP-ribosylglycohydrolase n=1 Tax=Kaistia soli DSM 19436 TaxID=1122133 RepID=A0A1M5IQW2_9HYPH|nr:ADP-ribosylglycohydrolase family protein [Kaistia soli]SHG30360.1 ADP-ribosylglycohydrolase [Kaistia soli DSM 19436]
MTASLNLAERIELVLAAACLGDALGAPPEAMHPAEIRKVFGGRITHFVPAPPMAPFSNGATPGSLTDDATQLLAMAQVIIEAGGHPTIEHAAKALIAWADDPRGFGKFAGPSTQAAIDRMRAGEDPRLVATPARYSVAVGTTNGAAMRAPVAGCIRPGDIDGAVDVAATLSAPTHNTQIAYAGAGAVAAVVAIGLSGGVSRAGKTLSLAEAAFAGAEAGDRLAATRGRLAPGPSVFRRMELAVAIGERYRGDIEACMTELGAVIGAGLPMAEAVPAAVGLAVAVGQDPFSAIVAAANEGADSDTVALISGAMVAAWSDSLKAPDDIMATLELVNGIDLGAIAADLAAVASA